MKTIGLILGIGISVMVFSACDSGSKQTASSESSSQSVGAGQSAVQDDVSNPNVVQVAVGSKDHTTLVAALKAAEYVDALSNVGPFTVFAPTNEAFDKLPAGTVDDLLKKENKRQLRDVLEYHVLLGVYDGDKLKRSKKIGTAHGNSVEITKDGDDVLVNGNKIVASINASNGVIHIVEGVLTP